LNHKHNEELHRRQTLSGMKIGRSFSNKSKVANGTRIKRIGRIVADNKIRNNPPYPFYLRSISNFWNICGQSPENQQLFVVKYYSGCVSF